LDHSREKNTVLPGRLNRRSQPANLPDDLWQRDAAYQRQLLVAYAGRP
jgi:hypothetical protein